MTYDVADDTAMVVQEFVQGRAPGEPQGALDLNAATQERQASHLLAHLLPVHLTVVR